MLRLSPRNGSAVQGARRERSPDSERGGEDALRRALERLPTPGLFFSSVIYALCTFVFLTSMRGLNSVAFSVASPFLCALLRSSVTVQFAGEEPSTVAVGLCSLCC